MVLSREVDKYASNRNETPLVDVLANSPPLTCTVAPVVT